MSRQQLPLFNALGRKLRQDSDSESLQGWQETDSCLLTHLLLLDNILKSLSTAHQPLAFPFCASRSICNLSCTRWSVGPRVRKPWGAVRCRRFNAVWPLLHQGPIDGHEESGLPRSHALMRSLGTTSEDDDSTQAAESVIGRPKSRNGHAGLVSVVALRTVPAVGTHIAPTTGDWAG